MESQPLTLDNIKIRQPTHLDGVSINRLVEQCPPLDKNSLYCNLLVCTHFSNTSAVAEVDGKLVGFVSGYFIPNEEKTLFIWQVAVDSVIDYFYYNNREFNTNND